jgi:hypothetical protein
VLLRETFGWCQSFLNPVPRGCAGGIRFATVGAVPSSSLIERDLAEQWLDSGSITTVEPRSGVRQPYPKRSELRRAEARATARRRPAGGRPSPGPAARTGPKTPSASTGRPAARLPIAVAPRPSVLPIPQTSDLTRPAGIDVPLPRENAFDAGTAFHAPAPTPPTVTIAVPLAVPEIGTEIGTASDGAPALAPAPIDLAAPLTSAVEAAEWGLELQSSTDGPVARQRTGLRTKRGHGLRMLVLALVVGAEGIAITQMAGVAHHAPSDPSTADISGAFALTSEGTLPAAAALQDSAERQQATVAAQTEALAAEKAQTASSDAKVTAALSQAKAAADRVRAAAARRARAMRDAQRNPKDIARMMASDRGWGSGQFSCLVSLWNRESGWNYRAQNASSGAYGIPQALPGSKMGTVAADWRTNPVTQIRWGLNYIADRYGTPCGAWGHSQATGWY